MKVEEEILDNPKASNQESAKFKSRVPSDLMIVVGLLHLGIGLYSLYSFFDLICLAFRNEEIIGFVINFELLTDVIFYRQFSFVFGLALFIGGVGLIRHKIRGWKYALGASIFGIVFPFLKLILTLIFTQITWTIMGTFTTLMLLVFVGSFFLLLSKTIKNFFKPQTIDFGVAAIVALVLSVDFLILLFV